jgi:hypothetical protein
MGPDPPLPDLCRARGNRPPLPGVLLVIAGLIVLLTAAMITFL